MKYFLDSAKMDEIKEAYETFGIDGVTTNPKHIMLSGKPFKTAIQDMADWAKEQGFKDYNDFPISVEVNPHLETAEEMMAMAREISKISPCFVIKIPCTEAGCEAARKLEKEGIRVNLTLVFSPAVMVWLPAPSGGFSVLVPQPAHSSRTAAPASNPCLRNIVFISLFFLIFRFIRRGFAIFPTP